MSRKGDAGKPPKGDPPKLVRGGEAKRWGRVSDKLAGRPQSKNDKEAMKNDASRSGALEEFYNDWDGGYFKG